MRYKTPMILNSMDKQLKLAEDGQITWQKDLTNPMPGEAVARIIKGEGILAPDCELIEALVLNDQDKESVLKFIKEWLGRYVQTTLEPLFKLKEDDIAEGAPRDIAAKLFDALGILPREDLQDLIIQMDDEKRATLRTKKIRFGPLIVYLPELNKPVTVRLRALLLTVWQGKPLPAEAPADGIVSFSVEGKDLNADYYRAIGYPIYGPRSIRVDMLDRVICAVYDSAKDGKFTAQHQMAEWLGSNIQDLYAVLEAMGHTKTHDPADVLKAAEDAKAEAAQAEEVKTENIAVEVIEPTETSAKVEEPKKEQVKPELATFRLKRGKAISEKMSQRGASGTSVPTQNKKFADKSFSSEKKKFKPKDKKESFKKPQGQRVYKAEAKENPEDNPFAVLQQLQVANNKDK